MRDEYDFSGSEPNRRAHGRIGAAKGNRGWFDYDAFQALDAEVAAMFEEAEADTAAGRVRPFADMQRDLAAKYGLPSDPQGDSR